MRRPAKFLSVLFGQIVEYLAGQNVILKGRCPLGSGHICYGDCKACEVCEFVRPAGIVSKARIPDTVVEAIKARGPLVDLTAFQLATS